MSVVTGAQTMRSRNSVEFATVNVVIEKRDLSVVPYEIEKIQSAVSRCFQNQLGWDKSNADAAAKKVSIQVDQLMPLQDQPVSVERVQDLVEQQLMALGYHEAAKQYILYREERRKIRDKKVPVETVRVFDEAKKLFTGQNADVQMFQALDKYARFDHSKGRRETWTETADRVVSFMKKRFGKSHPGVVTDQVWTQLQRSLLHMEASPSLRLVQMAGPALERCETGVFNCAFQALQNPTDMAEELYVLMQGCGAGFSVEQEHALDHWPKVRRQFAANKRKFVVEDTTESWCDSYKLGIETWLDGGDVEFDYSPVRPEGTLLKTKGGRASGPQPLKDLHSFARKRILARQGQCLSSLDLHDINCFAHRIVQMGGVRRASGISLSDLSDHLIRDCKSGAFWDKNPQRNQANNSAVYNEKPTAVQFMSEWLALAASQSGERGIFNRGSLAYQLPGRRAFDPSYIWGLNPCVTADTWVLTDEGPRQVIDLIDKPDVSVMVDGEVYASSGFFKTGHKPVLKITLTNGMTLKLTGNHQLLKVWSQSAKSQRTDWTEAKDLKAGDLLCLHNHRGVTWVGTGTRAEGWLLGSLLGDGCFGQKDQALLDYWGDRRLEMASVALQCIEEAGLTVRADCVGSEQAAKVGKHRVGSVALGELADSYGLDRDKTVSKQIEETSPEFYSGFLSGWFDADGSVQGSQQKGVSVRLSSSKLKNLQAAQRMLHRLGIMSTIYSDRKPAGYYPLPDGNGGTKEYYCEATHDLVIANDNIQVFEQEIGFSDPDKSLKLRKLVSAYVRKPNRDRFAVKIKSIEPAGIEDVYDCSVPGPNAFDANCFYAHNCGEINLRHKEFCNLSIVVIRPTDTIAQIREKVVTATIWGTLQSCMTNFNYLGDRWKQNVEEERLLGVDLLGHLDHSSFQPGAPGLEELLTDLKNLAIDTNRQWAKMLGIPASAAVTCGKPAGNSSQLFDTASGFKAHHGKYYVRRFRVNASNPLALMLKDMGVPVISDYDKSGLVIEFPIAAPENALILGDMSAIEQLEHWKTFKVHYTEHNPSVSIYVRDDEWFEVGNWVYANWEIVGGLSFFPFDDSVYPLAPYETISEEQYNVRKAALPEIDWSQITNYEKADMTTASQELACSGDQCAI